MISQIFAAAFLGLCVLAAIKDLDSLTIPNWLNGWLAFLFIPASIVLMPGWDVVGLHMLVGAIAFVICILLFALGVFGGGDAKMIPGVMLWIGPAGAMTFLWGMAMVGGILTVVVIMSRQFIPARDVPGFAYETLQEKKGVPYGIAIAGGAFLAAPLSPFLTQFLN